MAGYHQMVEVRNRSIFIIKCSRDIKNNSNKVRKITWKNIYSICLGQYTKLHILHNMIKATQQKKKQDGKKPPNCE